MTRAAATVSRLILPGVVAALAWVVLLNAPQAGLSWVCGADGLVPTVSGWDSARLGALVAMWGMMSLAMMLPCLMAAETRERVTFAAYLALPFVAGLAGALAQWVLESGVGAGSLFTDPSVRVALIGAIVLFEAGKWRRPSRAAPLAQMVCLQLLGDPMSVGWMAVVTLWMLADTLMPRPLRALQRWPILAR